MVYAVRNPGVISKGEIDKAFSGVFGHLDPDVLFLHSAREVIRGRTLEGDRQIKFALGKHKSFAAQSQNETWNAIGEILCCEEVRSGSSDLHAVYTEKSQDFDKYKEKFPIVKNQVGNIAVISRNGNKTFVLDLFDRHGILDKHHGNLISSYALEAGLRARDKVDVSKQEVRGFLDSVDSCDFQQQSPVSMGGDYKILGAGLQGSALLYSNALAYLNFFTKREDSGTSNSGNSGRSPGRREQVNNGRFSTGFYRPI